MEPVSAIVAGVGAALSAITGLISSAIAEGNYQEAERLRREAVKQYGADRIPTIEQFIARSVDPTARVEDVTGRGAQLRALAQLENVYSSEGTTPADAAAVQLAQDAGVNVAAGNLRGIEQGMRQQGNQNSGMRYALQAQAGQQGANVAGGQALQAQLAARQRALRALESSAGVGGAVRGDDYRALNDRASAADAMNRFNEGNRQWGAQFNANAAQQRFINAGEVVDRVAPGREMTRRGDATRTVGGGLGQAISKGTGDVAQYLDDDGERRRR